MYARILVPIDGSPCSDRGLDEAIALARLSGGGLRLLHIVDDLILVTSIDGAAAMNAALVPLLRQGGESLLQAGRARAAAAGLVVETCLLERLAGRVCDLVVEQAQAWPADLIVLGTHGRRGIGRVLLGSDAEQIVRQAPTPVLLVRASPPTAA